MGSSHWLGNLQTLVQVQAPYSNRVHAVNINAQYSIAGRGTPTVHANVATVIVTVGD